MNSILDTGDDDEEPEARGTGSSFSGRRTAARDLDPEARDPEITLGTMTVLAIFFALAVLCAGFFGFGYSVASKHTATTAVNPATGLAENGSAPVCKPAPGLSVASLATSTSSTQAPLPPARVVAAESSDSSTLAATSGTRPSSRLPVSPADSEVVGETPAATRVPARTASTVAPAATVAGPLAAGAPQTIVQVAALSHPEDAQIVVSALKSKGYDAVIHSSSQDKLLHVQIGPFASRKDADSMRLRLLSDGFNAILK